MKKVFIRWTRAAAVMCLMGALTWSCDKELYSDADAAKEAADAAAKRQANAIALAQEAAKLEWQNEEQLQQLLAKIEQERQDAAMTRDQQVSVSFLVRNLVEPGGNMAGFRIESSQFATATTDANGFAQITMRSGEALVIVSKDGYSRTLAFIRTVSQSNATPSRANEAFMIQVLPLNAETGKVTGTVVANLDLTGRTVSPVVGATVELVSPTSWTTTATGTDITAKGTNITQVFEGLNTVAVTNDKGEYSFDIIRTRVPEQYTVRLINSVVPVTGYFASPWGTNPVELINMKAWTGSVSGLSFGRFLYDDGSLTPAEAVFAGLNITIDAPGERTKTVITEGEISLSKINLTIKSTYDYSADVRLERGLYNNNAELTNNNFRVFSPTEQLILTSALPRDPLYPAAWVTGKEPKALEFTLTGSEITGLSDAYKMAYSYTINSRDGHNLGASASLSTFEQMADGASADHARANIQVTGVAGDSKLRILLNGNTTPDDKTGKGYGAVPNIWIAVAVDTTFDNRMSSAGGWANPRTVTYSSKNSTAQAVRIIDQNLGARFRRASDGALEFSSATDRGAGFSELDLTSTFNGIKIHVPGTDAAVDFDWTVHASRVRILVYTTTEAAPSYVGWATGGRAFVQTYITRLNPAAGQYSYDQAPMRLMDWGATGTVAGANKTSYFLNTRFLNAATVMTSEFIDKDAGIPLVVNRPGNYSKEPTAVFLVGNRRIAQASLKLNDAGALTGAIDGLSIVDATDWNAPISVRIPEHDFNLLTESKQAYARATVNTTTGAISALYVYDNTSVWQDFWTWKPAVSGVTGSGYSTVPAVKVEAIGEFSGTPAEIVATINANGEVSLRIVERGLGYNSNRISYPAGPHSYSNSIIINTNGSAPMTITPIFVISPQVQL